MKYRTYRILGDPIKVFDITQGNYMRVHGIPKEQENNAPNHYDLVEKSALTELAAENLELKAKLHFGYCDNCEPIGCCSGHMCGCMGQPVDFKHTDKCGDDCQIKRYQESKHLEWLAEDRKSSLENYKEMTRTLLEQKDKWIKEKEILVKSLTEISRDCAHDDNCARYDHNNDSMCDCHKAMAASALSRLSK